MRRLCNALDTAVHVLACLGEQGYTDAHDASFVVRPEKVIAETALLLLYASQVKHLPDVAARLEIVAQHLVPYARNEKMLLGMCLEPAVAIDYAQAHICLTRIGYPDKQFDRMLHKALAAQAAHGRERPPHRMLEQAWALELWRQSGVQRPQVAMQSILKTPSDLLACTRDDGYALTHALMYVADPHIRQWRLVRPRRSILAEASALLAWCIDQQDYDLGGELILAWPLTGKTWDPQAVFAFHVLAAVEDTAGFLPSPATRLERLAVLAGDERTRYVYATAYHTMYVMGLVCASALQPGCMPPQHIAAQPRHRNHGMTSALLAALDDGSPKQHWYAVFEALPAAQQDSLAEFLLAMALRRAAQAHSYEAMRSLLELAHAQGMDNSPIASQAAELLERLALFAELAA